MPSFDDGKGGGAGDGSGTYDYTGGGWRVAQERPWVVGLGSLPPPPAQQEGMEGEASVQSVDPSDLLDRVNIEPPAIVSVDGADYGDDLAVLALRMDALTVINAWDASDGSNLHDPKMGLFLPNFDGAYHSYIYEVRYSSDREFSLPKPDFGGTAIDATEVDVAYMRIHIPSFEQWEDMEWLGVVLVMEGGTSSSGAVHDSETDEDEPSRLLRSMLASGASWVPGIATPLNDPAQPFHFRSGDRMVTVTFNYPGRGELRQGLLSEGAADFEGDSPSNITGQDYAGEMTLAATEAVARVLLAIVEELRESWSDSFSVARHGALGSSGVRLVVCSNSWGLNPASRWIANTTIPVHALIDWEGPTDGAEAVKVTEAYDPYQLSNDPLPTYLTIEAFEQWALGGDKGFLFWFRPPHPDSFGSPLLSAAQDPFPDDWSTFLVSLRAVDPLWATMWEDRYQRSYSFFPLVDQLVDYWEEREAVRWLPEVTAKGTVYVRIQSNVDHNQPNHLRQRHAIKALNAAYSGDGSLVYRVDPDYWLDANRFLLDDASPRQVDLEYEVIAPDEATDDGAWLLDFDFWPRVALERVWAVHVDMVRWVMDRNFAGPAASRGVTWRLSERG